MTRNKLNTVSVHVDKPEVIFWRKDNYRTHKVSPAQLDRLYRVLFLKGWLGMAGGGLPHTVAIHFCPRSHYTLFQHL